MLHIVSWFKGVNRIVLLEFDVVPSFPGIFCSSEADKVFVNLSRLCSQSENCSVEQKSFMLDRTQRSLYQIKHLFHFFLSDSVMVGIRPFLPHEEYNRVVCQTELPISSGETRKWRLVVSAPLKNIHSKYVSDLSCPSSKYFYKFPYWIGLVLQKATRKLICALKEFPIWHWYGKWGQPT